MVQISRPDEVLKSHTNPFILEECYFLLEPLWVLLQVPNLN